VRAFYEPAGDDRYVATPSTAGPWSPGHQHAGPPAALLGRALEACEPRAEMALARVAFEILAPIPVAEVEVETAVIRPGRSVELLEATLSSGGKRFVTALAWRIRTADVPDGLEPPAPLLPRPDVAAPPPAGLQGFGYGDAVELRFAAGSWDEPGPATAWTRLRVPVVDGEEPSGLQRILAVADSGNGVSAVLPLAEWLCVNPELTVHLRREARGEWICLDAETLIAPGGTGLARSTISDADGPVAHGAQSLFVAPRP
jgi:hypothetical protein